MAKFEVLKEATFDYGANFIEISRKRVTGDDGVAEFINFSKGFYNDDQEKTYKSGFGFLASNKEAVEFIKRSLDKMLKEGVS